MFNRFISFEGIDGSGKTTQSKKLANVLSGMGRDVVWTREIGGTVFAEKVRDIMLHDDQLSSETELMLVMAARSDHLEKLITPALTAKKMVICDRFIDSTVVYQGQALGSDIVFETHINLFGSATFPTLTFFIDIPPEIAIDRTEQRGDNSKFERKDISFFHEARRQFLWLSSEHFERIIVIDGNRSEDEIHAEILKIVLTRFAFDV